VCPGREVRPDPERASEARKGGPVGTVDQLEDLGEFAHRAVASPPKRTSVPDGAIISGTPNTDDVT
jgi:hypothetical protein